MQNIGHTPLISASEYNMSMFLHVSVCHYICVARDMLKVHFSLLYACVHACVHACAYPNVKIHACVHVCLCACICTHTYMQVTHVPIL